MSFLYNFISLFVIYDYFLILEASKKFEKEHVIEDPLKENVFFFDPHDMLLPPSLSKKKVNIEENSYNSGIAIYSF